MTNQEINQLGSDIRRLHNEIVDLAYTHISTNELKTEFTSKLLDLINEAINANKTVKRIVKQMEYLEKEQQQ